MSKSSNIDHVDTSHARVSPRGHRAQGIQTARGSNQGQFESLTFRELTRPIWLTICDRREKLGRMSRSIGISGYNFYMSADDRSRSTNTTLPRARGRTTNAVAGMNGSTSAGWGRRWLPRDTSVTPPYTPIPLKSFSGLPLATSRRLCQVDGRASLPRK